MEKKNLSWLLLIPLAIIAVIWMMKGDGGGWMELEEKQDMFQVKFENCNCERPDHEFEHDHYLVPKDVIINFFGYLKAGEYANVASFFDPEVMVAYFYEEKSAAGYKEKIQEFGNGLSRNDTLEDARIVEMQKAGLSQYRVKVELRYQDGTKLTKEILLEERTTEERLQLETFILTKPNELLEK